jgi:hypothetical protein
MISKLLGFLWENRRYLVNKIVLANTVLLELFLHAVFTITVPIIVLMCIPIWLPIMITFNVTRSILMVILDYTPIADWIFKSLHFVLYDLTWWPRKLLWKIFYALDAW